MAGAYDDSTIVSMKFLQHVREKSGMYAFQLNNVQGLHQQLKEVVDNSVDEALDKKKFYPIDITFFVSKDKSNYQCIIQDRGRGIPVNKLADCYCKPFTSGKYRGEYGGSSSGTFGIGSKASAALAKIFIAFTKRDDGFGYLRVEKGVTKDYVTSKKRIDKDPTTIGTTVFLQPDDTLYTKINEMFKDNVAGEDYTGIESYISRLEYYSLFKSNVGITVRVVEGLLRNKDLEVDPVELWKFMTHPEKFESKIIFQSDNKITPREYIQRKFNLKDPIWDLGHVTKDLLNEDDMLTYDMEVFIDEKTLGGNGGIIAAVNATPIVHQDSSHLAVLQQVLKDQVANAIDDSEKQVYFLNKYRIPISGYVFTTWQGAEFIGQDKSRFENRQFEVCYRQFLRKEFKRLGEVDPTLWDRLWELIQENFEIEYAKYSRTAYKTGGDLKNLCYDLKRAKSFFNCELKSNGVIKTELFITEGDSAAGRVKSERDTKTQAVFNLSGKPKNAIRDDGPKLKENVIYSDLCRIIGVNRSDTNLDNMRFDRILLMTDADADGYHIVALMIGMFYKINPLILEEGRVLITNPPLYSILHGNKAAYLRDFEALEEARRISYRTLFDIDVAVTADGKTTKYHINKDANQFRDICLIVDMIGETVTRQADLLNIDPMVLEQLLHCVDYLDENHVDCNKIKDILMAEDVVWDKTNNVVVLVYEQDTRSIEYRIPLAKLQMTLRKEVLPIYERFHWKQLDFFVTTKYSDLYVEEPCTIMVLYDMFKKISDPNKGLLKVRRFKGLGEMSREAIKYTCIDPTTRSFTVVKSIGDVDRIYKMLGVDTTERKKLIKSGFVEEV